MSININGVEYGIVIAAYDYQAYHNGKFVVNAATYEELIALIRDE